MSSHGEVKLVGGRRVATPEYRAWQAMKNRCLNPKGRNFAYYGAKGITVYPPWVESFDAFLAHVGRRPEPHLTLDRIDTGKGYEPGNVRWADRSTQSRNRPYAKVRAWKIAEAMGVSQKTVYHMLWEIRSKDRGHPERCALSPELEAKVRKYMESYAVSGN